MPEPLNITQLNQETQLETSDRMLLWDSQVTSQSNIKYVTVEQLSASVAAYVTPTVINSGSASYIIKPNGATNGNVLTYNGTTWVASSTAPANTVANTSIQNGSVDNNKLATDAVTNVKVAASGISASKIVGGSLDSTLIPDFDASKLTGTINNGRLLNIPSSKIDASSGAFSAALIPAVDATTAFNAGMVPIARGGTNASTALGALSNLSGYGGPNDAKPGRRIFIQASDPTTVAGGSYTLVDGDLWFKI